MKEKEKIFIVDDDPSARQGLTRLLKTAGYRVKSFATRDQFLESVKPPFSGCVIMDVRMPGAALKKFPDQLKRKGITMPLIVVTADDDPAAKLNARQMNAAAFFHKPVDGVALLDAVEWALIAQTNQAGV